MIDPLAVALKLLNDLVSAQVHDHSVSTAIITMARDHAVELLSRESDQEIMGRLLNGSLHQLRDLLRNSEKFEAIIYTHGLGSSSRFLEEIDSQQFTLRNLLIAMMVAPAFKFRAWQEAFGETELTVEIENYIFSSPKLFLSDDDRREFINFSISLCDLLFGKLGSTPHLTQMARAARFLSRVRHGVAYSCEGSLKELAGARGRLITRFVQATSSLEFTNDAVRSSNGPIRVGLFWSDAQRRTENVVGVASCSKLRDFGIHVTSFVFRDSDRAVFGRSLQREIRDLSDQYLTLFDKGVDDAVDFIRGHKIDFLLILNNITWGFNDYIAVCAHRLARAQAVNFCAVCTTGFDSIDYFVSGCTSEQSKSPQELYTEQLLLLPRSCLIFDKHDYKTAPARTGIFDKANLSAMGTVFGSGANFYKLHPVLTSAWIELLHQTPNSVLVLYPFNPNWDWHYPWTALKVRLEQQCKAKGVDFGRIIVVGAWQGFQSIRELLTYIDIYLDSFPHSGGLSSLDAISLSIPIVTMAGATQRANQSSDLLRALELEAYIASSVEEYLSIAVELAVDPVKWAVASSALRERWRGGVFFDSDRYSCDMAKLIAGLFSEDHVGHKVGAQCIPS